MTPDSRPTWLLLKWLVGGAAALAVTGVGVHLLRPEWGRNWFSQSRDRRELRELIDAAAKEPERPVRGRLPGFQHAPGPAVARRPVPRPPSAQLQMATERALVPAQDPVVRATAYVLANRAEDAITLLDHAGRGPDEDNLLAVALMERARLHRRSADWVLAQAAASRALSARPDFSEARFNLALALEGAGHTRDASAAWNDAVAKEHDAAWLSEAREHATAMAAQVIAAPPVRLQPLSDLGIQVLNGTRAAPGDYEDTVWADAGSDCTATVVGPQALIMAGHCLTGSNHVAFDIRGTPATAECDASDQIDLPHLIGDLAMCRVTSPAGGLVFSGLKYETINARGAVPAVGDDVTVLGFGPSVQPPVLTLGTVTVQQLPSTNDEIVVAGHVTLTGGDSGGPGFYSSGSGRVIVAVNSRFIGGNQSGLSSVATARARAFLCQWTAANVPACGVRSGVPNCRVVVPIVMCP